MLLFITIACTNSGKDSGIDETILLINHYYSGNSVTSYTYNGQPNENPPETTLIRKTFNRENATLEEVVYQEGQEFIINFAVQEQIFTGTWESPMGTLEIEGTFLAGEQWEWTQWESTSTVTQGCEAQGCLNEGEYIESTDIITAGTLTATKRIFANFP